MNETSLLYGITYGIPRKFSPEKRLCLEVIHTAYIDYCLFWHTAHPTIAKLVNARDARAWFYSDVVKDFSFVMLCRDLFDESSGAVLAVRRKCRRELPTPDMFRESPQEYTQKYIIDPRVLSRAFDICAFPEKELEKHSIDKIEVGDEYSSYYVSNNGVYGVES